MLSLLKRFIRTANYQNLNCVEVIQSNIVSNFSYLATLDPHISVLPVLKSNAYGHGIKVVGEIIDQLHPLLLCVDSLFEAYELYKNHTKSNILVMGHTPPQNISYKKLPFSYAVYNKDFLHAVKRYQPKAGIHLFIDTGMHREGIRLEELPTFIELLKQYKIYTIEGVMTHLAAADNPKSKDTLAQLQNFHHAVDILTKNGVQARYVHGGASSALLRHILYGKYLGNAARAGSALYGIDPAGLDTHLKPALRLISVIGSIKLLKRGEKIGYDFTYEAKSNMTIATLPIGYHDGVERELSNKGVVLVDGIACPIVGLISMNITTIDISKVKNPYIGQRVIIYSDNPTDPNSILNVSKLTEKSAYELMIHITPFTKRVVV